MPSAAHSAAFFTEARNGGLVFGVQDEDGLPAPQDGDGVRAMPFWSRLSRAEKIVASVPAYTQMKPVEIALDEFINRWLPGLERDGLLVGLNWSGARATGYDLTPSEVLARLTFTGVP